MRTRIITTLLLAILMSYQCAAQSDNKKVPPEDKAPIETFKDPVWAPKGYHSQYHVYFPDYQTFYDPHRGYVTRVENSWVVSSSMPLFLSGKDLTKTRIQILEDITLDMRPELNYPRYMKMYPASPGMEPVLVPVPKPAGQSGTP